MNEAVILKKSNSFLTVQKRCLGVALAFLLSPQVTLAQEEVVQESGLPAVTVVEEKAEVQVRPTAMVNECDAILVNHDIEARYKKIQEALEADYAQGMPKQLKTDLIRVRQDIDALTVKLYEVDPNNTQEVNHITQLTVDYLEKMISLLPKANKIAPQVRDRYVVPFTNISSIKAEHQECLMKQAVAEVRDKDVASESDEPSINIYRKLTSELERLNSSLYTLQTTDVDQFVSYRSRLLSQLEDFNETRKNGATITGEIPPILHNVHREIEKLLPGLELSKDYLTLAH